jgi:hypothetical protein|tara:strand:+ start:68 stop:514 length:447 start_codon:yes stop_codon:yes gene_type:complete
MAKIGYSWARVKRGDIISFRYKNKEGKTLRRTILVLEPKLSNTAKNPSSKFLMHGIQLEISNRSVNAPNVMQNILESAGVVDVVDEDKEVYRVDLEKSTKAIYSNLKSLIKQHGIYRTYSLEKAKKSQVFLDDLKLPSTFVKELVGED